MADLMATLTRSMHADPHGTSVLLSLSVMDAVREMHAEVLPEMVDKAMPQMREGVARAKAGLVRTYVAKAADGSYPDAEHLRTATWIAGIETWLDEVSKASLWETWTTRFGRKRREVNRDASGRFSTSASVSRQSKPVVGADKDSLPYGRIGWVKSLTYNNNGTVALRDPNNAPLADGMATFQHSFETSVDMARQAVGFLGSAANDAKVVLRTTDADAGPVTVDLKDLADPKGAGKKTLDKKFANKVERITAVEIKPKRDKMTDAQVDALNAFNAEGMMDKFNLAAAHVGRSEASRAMAPRGAYESRIGVAMNRAGVLGEALNAVAPGLALAQVGRYIGMYGPEAVAVLSPHVKRAAYRYRGTERTPDRDLTASIQGPGAAALDSLADAVDSGKVSIADATAGIGPARNAMGKPTSYDDPVLQSMRYRGALKLNESGDSLRLGVRSDVAALELLKTLPKESLIGQVSRLSGQGIPSQGVLIDADGDVISQSVGFANDHYLPFNLAAMGRVRGGQYVRTRERGGLTGEDIMTMMATGVRSATVASGSGVFRLEMDPSFRGARANSDKALAMFDRYLKILDAIGDKENELYSTPLPEDKMEAIQAEALRIHKDPSLDPYKKYVEAKVAEARREQTTITPADRAKVAEEAKRESNGDPRTEEELTRIKMWELKRAKSTAVNLNGEGYALALRTLAQQFPYFIRSVEYTPLQGNPRHEGTSGTLGEKGFLGRMGASLGTARSTRGEDKNYERPGRESWRTRAEAPRSTEESEKAPEVPKEAPKATGGTGTGSGGSKPSKAPPAPSTGTPAAAKAAAKAQLSASDRAKAIEALIDPISAALSKNPEPGTPSSSGLSSFDAITDMADQPVARQLEWLLRLDSSSFVDQQAASPEMVFRALSAPEKDWRTALQHAFSAEGIKQVMDDKPPYGAKDENELIQVARERAKVVSNAILGPVPFVTADEDSVLTVAGQAIDYPEYTAADTKDALEALLGTKEAKGLVNLIAELGVDSGGRMNSIAATAEQMKPRVDALAKLEDKRKKLEATPSLRDQKIDAILGNDITAEDLDLLGLTKDDAARLVDQKDASGHRENEVRELAERWQRARTLLEVARANDVIEAGGALPKAWSALVPAWVKARLGTFSPKVEKASSRLRVAPADSPLARLVGLRSALQLPLAPPRSG